MTAPRPTGSIDIWNFVDNVTGTTVRKWLRDSWARKKIVALQQAVAAIVVPTRTSQLTNDSGYITQEDVPPGSTPSSTTPLMDGTGAAGSSANYARADHVHPSDTAKQDALTAAQLEAVDSGITAAKVSKYDGLQTMFGVPTAIASGDDLDDYTTLGLFSAPNGAVAGSLINCPVTVNFALFVFYRTPGLISQVIIPSNRNLYTRYRTSTAWSGWTKFTGTAV